MSSPANLISTLLYQRAILAPITTGAISADPLYPLIPATFPGWDTGTEYVSTNGRAAFVYTATHTLVQQWYNNGTKTTHLPYAANTKYYMEIALASVSSQRYWMLGVAADSMTATVYTTNPGVNAASGAGYGGMPNIGTAFTNGNVIMIAYNTANNQVYIGKNGVWPVSPVSGTGVVIPGASTATPPRLVFMRASVQNYTIFADGTFVSSGFTYAPPTGYVALE